MQKLNVFFVIIDNKLSIYSENLNLINDTFLTNINNI